MKTKILSFLLFFTFFIGFSQTMEALKTQTENMYASAYKMDVGAAMDLTYPKIFEFVDRATLQAAMESVYNNEMMTISIVNEKVSFKYADIKEIEGKRFCVIKYQNAMKMTMKQKPDPEVARGMIDGMKSAGKYSNVTYDDKTNAFLIEGESVLIAVSDATTKNQWAFVNYDNEELFKLVFNENIKKELGL